MNKRLIILLGLVMGLVLLSLITVQINWIRNAFMVKEKQFDQMVHQALTEVSNKIAQEETYQIVLDEIYAEIATQQAYSKLATDSIFTGNKQKNNLETAVTQNDTLLENLKRNLKNDQSEVQQKLLLEKQQYLNEVLSRMLTYTPEIEQRLNSNEVEAISNETFLDYGIDITYEFAVIKWNNFIAFQSPEFNPEEQTSIYRVRLYQDDFAKQPNYLDVYFPNKKNFIFRSMAFIGISSGVLTILIVFTFAFTLYVIFKQKRLSEIKNDFVNNMTHELKTPISTISLASQMLGDNSIPNESKNLDRISKIIKQESKRLGYQVEKVLQIASIDRGNLKLNLKTSDLHDVIENVASNFNIQVDAKGGLLIPSLHAETSEVKIDPVHMGNVISNLLDNAIKYTRVTPEILIETQNVGTDIRVSVKDNGIGISRANQKRVFERFYRVSTGNLHDVKGFGLGLNYVKKIIEMHNGVIDIDSEPGTGTTFNFTIPLKNHHKHG